MTTINDISDLARVLQDNPQWRDTIRGIVLGEELLQLPQQLAAFIEATDRRFETIDQWLDAADRRTDALEQKLAAFIEATQRNFELVNQRLERLEIDLSEFRAEVDDRFKQVDNRLRHLDGRMDNGFGLNYEFKIEKNLDRIAMQHLQVRGVKVEIGPRNGATQKFSDLLEEAENQGTITMEQNGRLRGADLVFSGLHGVDRSEVHVAAEISITASDNDIIRAKDRAGILNSVLNQPTMPIIVVSRIEDPQTSTAVANGVTIVLMPDE